MQADMLLRGGAVYTMDPSAPRTRSLAVANGTVVACSDGPLDELEGRGTRIIDLAGRAVVPGFVDAHIHFGHFALARRQVDLDVAASLEDGLALLRDASRRMDADAWLHGRGWDRNRWGRLPTATELDNAIGPRPAALSSHDGHALWLSSAALQSVGIHGETPDPPGGVIQRDERGQPTGVLFENAQELARRGIPEPSDDELRDALRAALPLAAAAGLTGIHNLEDRRARSAFEELERAGELSLRVYHGVARGELRAARDTGLRTGAGSERVRTGPVKLFSDGALGSRTAHVLEPYEGRVDGYRGVPTMQPEEIADHMRLAAEAELDIAVHAIGDAAVRAVLDAFEQTRAIYPPLGRRMLRIEHAQLVHPRDVPRFAALGVIASMQPIHATADWRAADAHWGRRAQHGYAWRDLLQAGAVLAFGTDAPVERLEPLNNLYAAVTRIDPEGQPDGGWYPQQRLTLDEAMRAYTLGSAMAERASNRRGTLAPGKDADFVVLSPDPFGLRTEALLEARVELTVVGGHVVMEALA
jgi:predicted amidohydrolase YtcJ